MMLSQVTTKKIMDALAEEGFSSCLMICEGSGKIAVLKVNVSTTQFTGIAHMLLRDASIEMEAMVQRIKNPPKVPAEKPSSLHVVPPNGDKQ